jgi:hypothetical protein
LRRAAAGGHAHSGLGREASNPAARSGRGATTGGNAEAWADALRQATAFFGRHLSQKE